MSASKKFKVRKGLDANLLLSGLLAKDYYVFLSVCLGVAVFLFFSFGSVVDQLTLNSLFFWLLKALLSGFLVFLFFQRLRKNATKKKYDFVKTVSGVSNSDIFQYLKK